MFDEIVNKLLNNKEFLVFFLDVKYNKDFKDSTCTTPCQKKKRKKEPTSDC